MGAQSPREKCSWSFTLLYHKFPYIWVGTHALRTSLVLQSFLIRRMGTALRISSYLPPGALSANTPCMFETYRTCECITVATFLDSVFIQRTQYTSVLSSCLQYVRDMLLDTLLRGKNNTISRCSCESLITIACEAPTLLAFHDTFLSGAHVWAL